MLNGFSLNGFSLNGTFLQGISLQGVSDAPGRRHVSGHTASASTAR